VRNIGILGMYDSLNEHLRQPRESLRRKIGEIERRLRENELLDIIKNTIRRLMDAENERIEVNKGEIEWNIAALLSVREMLGWEYTCNFRTLYEVTLMGIKNRLMAKQIRDIKEEKQQKMDIIKRLEVLEWVAGKESIQYRELNSELKAIIHRELVDRAGKYREFFEKNNEKPTRAYLKLGKVKNQDDNTSQIRDGEGNEFRENKERGNYIGEFYSGLYKKKIDRVIQFDSTS
jgi:hypothetical protein